MDLGLNYEGAFSGFFSFFLDPHKFQKNPDIEKLKYKKNNHLYLTMFTYEYNSKPLFISKDMVDVDNIPER